MKSLTVSLLDIYDDARTATPRPVRRCIRCHKRLAQLNKKDRCFACQGKTGPAGRIADFELRELRSEADAQREELLAELHVEAYG